MSPGTHYGHSGSSALLIALILAAILLAYLMAVMRLRRAGAWWSGGRIASFTIDMALLATAFMPLGTDGAHLTLRSHMLQHLLLGMFAPIGLVLGAPGTLLLRTVPVRVARRLVAMLAVRPVRWLMHPVSAGLLDIGGMYLLYLTPLFVLTLTDQRFQGLVHLHFVLAGYLFTWSIIGPDPAPHRPGLRTRLVVLFSAAAAHAILAKILYGYGYPRGTSYDLGQLQSAAQWMYYGGDLAEVLIASVFLSAWIRRYRSTRPKLAVANIVDGKNLEPAGRSP